jgi:hypothetical protein
VPFPSQSTVEIRTRDTISIFKIGVVDPKADGCHVMSSWTHRPVTCGLGLYIVDLIYGFFFSKIIPKIYRKSQDAVFLQKHVELF